LDGWQEQPHQHADDRNHDEKLDEGKSVPLYYAAKPAFQYRLIYEPLSVTLRFGSRDFDNDGRRTKIAVAVGTRVKRHGSTHNVAFHSTPPKCRRP
jgi:hypothetical protein